MILFNCGHRHLCGDGNDSVTAYPKLSAITFQMRMMTASSPIILSSASIQTEATAEFGKIDA